VRKTLERVSRGAARDLYKVVPLRGTLGGKIGDVHCAARRGRSRREFRAVKVPVFAYTCEPASVANMPVRHNLFPRVFPPLFLLLFNFFSFLILFVAPIRRLILARSRESNGGTA